MSASNKDEFESVYKRFVTNESLDKSIIFEVFTNSQDESDALYAMSNIYADSTKKMADVVRSIFGDSAVQTVKKIIGK